MGQGQSVGPLGGKPPIREAQAGLQAGAAEPEIPAHAAVEGQAGLEGVGLIDRPRLAVKGEFAPGRQVGFEEYIHSDTGAEKEAEAIIAGRRRIADHAANLFARDFTGGGLFRGRRVAFQPEADAQLILGRFHALGWVLIRQFEDHPGRVGFELSGPNGPDSTLVHLQK